MPRATSGPRTNARRKKVLKQAKGYVGARGRLFRTAKNQVTKSLQYAYRDRRNKKRAFRRLWISRINAAVRQHGMRYNEFMHAITSKGIGLDRKILADIALSDPEAFANIVEQVRTN